MSTGAVLLDVALIVTFAAGILYWVFVTPKRDKERWRKQLEVGGAAPHSVAASSRAWEDDPDAGPRGR